MPDTLIAYKASQPSNSQSIGVLPGGNPLPHQVGVGQTAELADIGIFLNAGPENRVDLIVTVGLFYIPSPGTSTDVIFEFHVIATSSEMVGSL